MRGGRGILNGEVFMKITATGHSGFLVELKYINFIFDYYTDKQNVVTPEIFKGKTTYVFVSHRHGDHFNKKIFGWDELGDVKYILDAGCKAPGDVKKTVAREGGDFTVGDINVKVYGSTDEGVSFLVAAEGVTLFHAGDLNDWYWADESTPEELAADEESYLKIIRALAGTAIDVAFIPEDKRLKQHAGRGIRFFKEIVAPKTVVPMHFNGNDGRVYEVG